MKFKSTVKTLIYTCRRVPISKSEGMVSSVRICSMSIVSPGLGTAAGPPILSSMALISGMQARWYGRAPCRVRTVALHPPSSSVFTVSIRL